MTRTISERANPAALARLMHVTTKCTCTSHDMHRPRASAARSARSNITGLQQQCSADLGVDCGHGQLSALQDSSTPPSTAHGNRTPNFGLGLSAEERGFVMVLHDLTMQSAVER